MADKMKRFKLKNEFLNGGEVWLGGHRAGEPERVCLTKAAPYVDGDEYGIYEGTVLREVPPVPSVEEKSSGLAALKAKKDSGEPLKATEVVEEAEPESDVLEDDMEMSEAPEPPEPEDLTLDSDTEEEGDSVKLPSAKELEEMTRSELERLALQLGVLDEIDGTGSGQYKTVPDFRDYLTDLLEEDE